MTKTLMFRIIAATIMAATLVGCGSSEPSNEEIARGFMRAFVSETGVTPSFGKIKAKAHKIGNGRWAVQMKAERYDGECRTLNATAVIDKNGAIHYYTD